MGQAHSRRPDDSPARAPGSTRRPASWAPSWPPSSSSSPPASALPPLSRSSRPLSQRFNPFNVLTTHDEHHESASDRAPANAALSTFARRRSRMSRARSSLSSLPTLLHRRVSSRSRDADSSSASASSPSFSPAARAPLRHSTSAPYDRLPLHPQVQVPELDLDFGSLPTGDGSLARPNSQLDRASPPRRDGRASSLLPSFRPERGLRSMTSQLRRRRSPPGRDEDQAAMLSQLLSVAAAATAASLMGDDHRAISEARSVAGDGEDGTFDSFLQALQNGRMASALRQTGGNDGDEGSESAGGSPAPLNFFRMFRFGSAVNRRLDSRTIERARGTEEDDDRMVPIIIVGIRSIPPGAGSIQDENIPPFLDALSSFPGPPTSPGDSSIDGMLRQPQQRFSHRRRASMGGLNTFPSNYDSQRHYRAPERPRPWSSFTDSPAGPLPPPSTPASGGLSAISSGTNTPALSTSPPSPTIQSTASSRRGSFVRRTNTASNLEPTVEEPPAQPRMPRQRRMSESDFTRFGSGAARRNGVVEPDHNPGEGSRSWIIYVLGGSYPENHPILTTPSLFTDSPTHEDMLLLQSLLGPVKPPVASAEDVAAAPGSVTIQTADDTDADQGIEVGSTIAVPADGTEPFALAADAQCLVCLSGYSPSEEARKLAKCGHMFHKTCIDLWLTTGRNSCPLCRGQGVDESADKEQSATPTEATEVVDGGEDAANTAAPAPVAQT